MYRIVTFTVIIALVAPGVALAQSNRVAQAIMNPATHPDLLESAAHMAGRASLGVAQNGCGAAAARGAEAARDRQGRAGWLIGGLFIPVIMPIVAHVSSPNPPADMLVGVESADVACFSEGYASAARGRRVGSSWLGTGIGIGLWTAMAVAVADEYGY